MALAPPASNTLPETVTFSSANGFMRLFSELPGIAFVTGGLQGRIRDFLVEAKVKYSGGSSANALSPANGSTILLSGTYYFLP